MTFIDWSDSEGIFGLLVDFVADARGECEQDNARHRFLSELLTELMAVESRIDGISTSTLIQGLRDAYESVDREWADDTVMVHVRDCIEEIQRLEDGADNGGPAAEFSAGS